MPPENYNLNFNAPLFCTNLGRSNVSLPVAASLFIHTSVSIPLVNQYPPSGETIINYSTLLEDFHFFRWWKETRSGECKMARWVYRTKIPKRVTAGRSDFLQDTSDRPNSSTKGLPNLVGTPFVLYF